MDYTFKELKHMTVAEMREIAKDLDHEAVKGYTQLNKDHLLEALCKALGIETHEHHEYKGVNKGKIKAQIKGLKKDRDSAIEKKEYAELKKIRNEIKKLKNKLKRAMV